MQGMNRSSTDDKHASLVRLALQCRCIIYCHLQPGLGKGQVTSSEEGLQLANHKRMPQHQNLTCGRQ